MTSRKVIRVLHVYRRFQPDYTGDGIYFTKLIAMLAAQGIEGEVLVLDTRTGDGEPLGSVGGIAVHYLANEYGRSGVGAVVSWLWRNIWRFHVVHAHSHVDRWFISYLFARLCGRKVIFSSSLNDSPTDLIAGYRPRYRPIVGLLSRLIPPVHSHKPAFAPPVATNDSTGAPSIYSLGRRDSAG